MSNKIHVFFGEICYVWLRLGFLIYYDVMGAHYNALRGSGIRGITDPLLCLEASG